MNDRGGDAGAVPAIAPVDVLDDFLAPLVFEIDIDVRRLVTLVGQETLEQNVERGGIHRGDAEHVADGGVGGRPPALAHDALVFGDADKIEDREKIRRQPLSGDEDELLAQQALYLLRYAPAVFHPGMEPDAIFKILLACPAVGYGLLRIFVTQMVKIEVDQTLQHLRLGDRFGCCAEEARHFLGPLEMTFAIHLQQATGSFDLHALPDARHHVLQVALDRIVIEHVVRGDEADMRLRRNAFQLLETAGIIAAPVHGDAEPGGRSGPQRGEQVFNSLQRCAGHDDEQEIARQIEHGAQGEAAFALKGAAGAWRFTQISGGEDAAEATPAFTIDRIGHDIGRTIDKGKARADAQLEPARTPLHLGTVRLEPGRVGMLDPAGLARPAAFAHARGCRQAILAHLFQRRPGAHDASHRVAVCDADGCVTKRQRLQHHVLSVGGAAQEREIRGGDHFGIGLGRRASLPCLPWNGAMCEGDDVTVHAKTPCRYQAGCASVA